MPSQVVEELFAYWSLEDADDTLEELEEALIVCLPGTHDCLFVRRAIPVMSDVSNNLSSCQTINAAVS